jgi:hypothetical protein
VHRTLCALATSIALVVALNVGAAAAGASHSSPKPHGHGSIHDQSNGIPDNEAKTGADSSAHGTLQFGPFASGSPDSGTCGNDWATDTFDRFFTVVTNEDGTTRVVEFFKDATFVTAVLPATRTGTISSPGACQNGVNNGGLVTPGVQGRFQGYFLISVSGATLDPRLANCTVDTCGTTKTFIATVFGASASYDVTTFLFNYSSSDQRLIQRHWKNASEDRGGNLGDIRSS